MFPISTKTKHTQAIQRRTKLSSAKTTLGQKSLFNIWIPGKETSLCINLATAVIHPCCFSNIAFTLIKYQDSLCTQLRRKIVSTDPRLQGRKVHGCFSSTSTKLPSPNKFWFFPPAKKIIIHLPKYFSTCQKNFPSYQNKFSTCQNNFPPAKIMFPTRWGVSHLPIQKTIIIWV